MDLKQELAGMGRAEKGTPERSWPVPLASWRRDSSSWDSHWVPQLQAGPEPQRSPERCPRDSRQNEQVFGGNFCSV